MPSRGDRGAQRPPEPSPRLGSKRPARRVDLHRLPMWLQYALALLTVVVVGGLALASADGDEGPSWLTDTAPPILGVLAIAVAVGMLLARLLRGRRR